MCSNKMKFRFEGSESGKCKISGNGTDITRWNFTVVTGASIFGLKVILSEYKRRPPNPEIIP